MRLTLTRVMPAAVLALAGQLWAGGFFLQTGNPEANPEARKLHAVLTIKPAGCHDAAAVKITATAIGMVDGRRREIPLKLDALGEPGMVALAQQWPQAGRWVLHLVATDATGYTNALLVAGPSGVDRVHQRAGNRPFTAAEIDEMLRP